jgi:methylthioribose-1-phosphate isomerase
MTDTIVNAIKWTDNTLLLLDQRVLPEQEVFLSFKTASKVAEAIQTMVVRGAPAIGITAAYGIALAALDQHGSPVASLKPAFAVLAASRPTAVNLFWALQRMQERLDSKAIVDANALLAEALLIHSEDLAANMAMGEAGAGLIQETGGGCVLTHCNTGSLATGGFGTALGVIRTAFKQGLIDLVYADETRPWLQGSRLTAWELAKDHIPVMLIADSAAAYVLKTKPVRWVIVGADRITANGDVANKIGTYSLAVLARYHGVKFMVVAPFSTIDFALQSGQQINVEERSADELKFIQGRRLAPDAVNAFNPVFDVTPGGLIDAIVTERGVVVNPDIQSMSALKTNGKYQSAPA